MPKPLNGEFYTKDDDALMLTTPEEWPAWPMLPLKRRGTEAGLLFGDPPADGSITVYLANMFESGLNLESVGTIRYDSAIACVDDGWKVD